MKKIFKKFWVTQGCQETPLNIGVLLIFSGGLLAPLIDPKFFKYFFRMVINPIEVKIFECIS